MQSTDDLRGALGAMSSDAGDWLARLDELEASGVLDEIADAPASRRKGLIKVVQEELGLSEDERKDVTKAVAEAAKRLKEEKSSESESDDCDSIAKLLVVLGQHDELIHDREGNAYACIDHGEDGVEVVGIGSGRHEEVLALRVWKSDGVAPSSSAFGDAGRTLRAIAKAEGEPSEVYLRHAFDPSNECYWYDLADTKRQAVRIAADGWSVVHQPDVRFQRFRNTAAQVVPVSGGSIDTLRELVNVEDDGHWSLFLGWTVQGILIGMPRFGMTLSGGQGSAKSTAARIARSIVDPAVASSTKLPKTPDDFAVVASTNAILAADNVSTIDKTLSDMLCAAITGDGYARRTKYRDRDESVWQYQLPVLLNGIGNIVAWPDLLERMLLVRCPRIPAGKRKLERAIWTRYNEIAPEVVGAVFDTAVQALGILDQVAIPTEIRMADAARVMIAVGRVLGRETEMTLALQNNTYEQIMEALDASLIAAPLIEFLMNQGGFEGSMTTLLRQLNHQAPDTVTKERVWPRSARSLSSHVSRIAPALEHIGWLVTFGKASHAEGRGRRVWIEPGEKIVEPATVPTVPTVPDAEVNGLKWDGRDGRDGRSTKSNIAEVRV